MSDPIGALRATLDAALAARDRDAAISGAMCAVFEGRVTVPQLYDVLAALLADVGSSWQRGETEVWEEHLATATARTIVESCHGIVLEQAAPPNGHGIVLATPPEEYHDLGLRMLADHLTLAGWRVTFLGASLPARELAAAAQAVGADAAIVSAATHFHRLRLRAYVTELRARLPRLTVWVTGAAFAREAHDWPPEEVLDISAIPTLAERLGG